MSAAPARMSAADAATLAVTVALAGIGAAVMLAGPSELMPTHWNGRGVADAWSPREVVGGGLLALGLLTVAVAGGLGLAAGRSADTSRRRGLRVAQVVALMALTCVGLFTAGASLAGATTLAGALPMAGLSLLFLMVGALLGRVGPNPLVGVRTPWAYKSRRAWDRSNRLAGRLMFLAGLGGLAVSPLAPQPLGLQLLIGAVLVSAGAAVFESWRVWREDPDRQPF